MAHKQFGTCHICLQNAKLSADHVPPQSCKNKGIQQLVLEYILNENNVATTKKKTFQNGTKFYTICEKCNNDLLGGNYDREIEYFMKEVENQINSNNKIISVNININKLCRAICCKLLSMNSNVENNFIGNMLRQYIFDTNMKQLSNSKLFIRYYPYKDKIFYARNIFPLTKDYAGITSCLYFYPFAFMLTTSLHNLNDDWANIEKNNYNMCDLFNFTTNNINDNTTFSFDISSHINSITHTQYPYNFPFNERGMLLDIPNLSIYGTSIYK